MAYACRKNGNADALFLHNTVLYMFIYLKVYFHNACLGTAFASVLPRPNTSYSLSKLVAKRSIRKKLFEFAIPVPGLEWRRDRGQYHEVLLQLLLRHQ